MIAPKSPLPWLTYEDDENGIADYDREQIGDFYDLRDKAYAVHAANVLPEVVAALEACAHQLEHRVPEDCWATGPMTGDPYLDLVVCPGCTALAKARAALAKADAS